MATKREIGLNIKNLRKRAGLRQKDLAKMLDPKPTTKETISRVERGETNYSIDLLLSIAAALNVDISAFCPNTNSKPYFTILEGTPDTIKKMIREEIGKMKRGKSDES